ncbi:hypothetical protein ACS0TY_007510 [Phlomoides rotata]
MDFAFANLSLLEDKEEELLVESSHGMGGATVVEFSVVGRFVTDQPIPFNLMKARMASIWNPKKGVHMKEIGEGRFLFQLFHHLDVNRVMDGSPWSFGKFPLIVHHLKIGELPMSVPLQFIRFWIQIYGLPIGYFNETIGRALGNFVGRFLKYDASNLTSVWREFMRVRVEVNVDHPLKRFKKIKLGSGESVMVTFKYEKLKILCFICGKLDHQESSCDVLFNSPDEEVKREWGVFLKATDRRGHPDQSDKWLRRDGTRKTIPGSSRQATDMNGEEEEDSEDEGNHSLVPARRTERTTDSTSDYSLILNPTFISNSSPKNGGAIVNTPHDCKKRKLTQHNGGAIIPASIQGIAAGINSEDYSDDFVQVGSAMRAHQEP